MSDPESSKTKGLEITTASASMVAPDTQISMHIPLPPNNGMYNWVGLVASEWAYVEHRLDRAIWRLMDTDESKWKTFACATAGYGGQFARVKAIKSLCKYRGISVKTLRMITRLSNDLNSASEARNRVVHDAWFMSLPSSEFAQFRSMPHGDLTFGFKSVEPAEMERLVVEIRKLRDQVIDFDEALSRELQASP